MAEEIKKSAKEIKENIMRTIKIDKVVLSMGANGEELDKAVALLKLITNRTPMKTRSTKRIPSLGVRPGLEIGAVVTIRKDPEDILRKLLGAKDNLLKEKQIVADHFSFGIAEYIEIAGMEYQRDIGIMGLDVTVVFKRSGRRVKLKKIKRGKFSKRQSVSKEEIIKFMEDNFETEFA